MLTIRSDDMRPGAGSWLMPLDDDDVEPMTEETTLSLVHGSQQCNSRELVERTVAMICQYLLQSLDFIRILSGGATSYNFLNIEADVENFEL